MTVAGQRMRMPTNGHRREVDGTVLVDKGNPEYRRPYGRFAELIDRRESELDDLPLVTVADAGLVAAGNGRMTQEAGDHQDRRLQTDV